jgi:hypothetical protein
VLFGYAGITLGHFTGNPNGLGPEHFFTVEIKVLRPFLGGGYNGVFRGCLCLAMKYGHV